MQSAVIFGRGRGQIGVIIEPAKAQSFDPKDKEKLLGFREALWCVQKLTSSPRANNQSTCSSVLRRPTIERMNKLAPPQSQLSKEVKQSISLPQSLADWTKTGNQMIMVVLPSKPFIYTGKRLPRRKAAYADYLSEIDALYRNVDGAGKAGRRSSQGGAEIGSEVAVDV